jgi:hypothetical protein
LAREDDVSSELFDEGPDAYRDEFLFAVEAAQALHDLVCV